MKRNIFKTILLSACILQGQCIGTTRESRTGQVLTYLGVIVPIRSARMVPQRQIRHMGTLGSAMPTRSRRLVRSWHVRRGRCCLQVALGALRTSFGIRLQGCNQRMESRKMESGEAGSPFQENRCPIFLCYGQPSRQHGLVGQ